jgi:hypothetical protein|tara:strand:+ start:2860 stop:3102 length:243 start_codon:yes stop_codon:yes gene_type:complete
MTNKYSLNKIRKSRNEFEALLRIYGISNLRLCKVLEVNYATSKKFIATPTNMRFIHAKKLADYIGLNIQDIVDTVVYDIK